MKISQVSTSQWAIITNDGYMINKLEPVDDFEEKRLAMMDEDLVKLEELYKNVKVFKGESTIYSSPNDVGLELTSEIASKAADVGIEIKGRHATDNNDIMLIDLSAHSNVAATVDGDLEAETNEYYFICSE